jgi:hypothetical protein
MRKIRKNPHAPLTPFQKINRLLLGGCVVALFYAAAGFFGDRNRQPEIDSARSFNAEAGPPAGSMIQLADLTRRNLFQPLIAPSPPKVAAPVPAAPPPKIPLSQKVSRLHLVGVINGNPLQAIIEDREHQKTLTVTSGETINDIVVEKVSSDQILLRLDGETTELAL